VIKNVNNSLNLKLFYTKRMKSLIVMAAFTLFISACGNNNTGGA
jgi:hypothetical protein